MNAPAKTYTLVRFTVAVLAALAGIAAFGCAPAQARVFVSVGAPFGYYGPGPYYYGYPYSYPYAYYPPSTYYAPPTYPYYPPAYPAPTAYAAPAGAPTAAPAPQPAGADAVASVIYTSKPAFTNASGQTCREYRTTGGGRDIFGTACQQSDGQWRVVN